MRESEEREKEKTFLRFKKKTKKKPMHSFLSSLTAPPPLSLSFTKSKTKKNRRLFQVPRLGGRRGNPGAGVEGARRLGERRHLCRLCRLRAAVALHGSVEVLLAG